VREHMLSCLEKEQFGVILGSYCHRGGFLRVLGNEYVVPSGADLDYAHHTGVCLTREFNNRLLKSALDRNLCCIIHVHSHPFSLGNVSFSVVDDNAEREEAAWLGKHFPSMLL